MRQLTLHTGNLRQRLRRFFADNFFPTKEFFSWILSQSEFCLGLHAAVVFRMQSFNYVWVQRAMISIFAVC